MLKRVLSFCFVLILCLFCFACGGKTDDGVTAKEWDEAFELAANELLDTAVLKTDESIRFSQSIYYGNELATTIYKDGNKASINMHLSTRTETIYYEIENDKVNVYTPADYMYYTVETISMPPIVEHEDLIETSEPDMISVMVHSLPYRQLVGKFDWFELKNEEFVLKEEHYSSFNDLYLAPHKGNNRIGFEAIDVSVKIEGGRLIEYAHHYEYTIDGEVSESKGRRKYAYDDIPQITLPSVVDGGVYVFDLCFMFNDEQKQFIEKNLTGDEAHDASVYETAAQMIEFEDGLKLFGSGGLLETLETELKDASNYEALDIFAGYLYYRGDDNGEFNQPTGRGYFVPFSGESPYVEQFTKLARELFNEFDAHEKIIGNAFLDGHLAYTISKFGVHILMIRDYIS